MVHLNIKEKIQSKTAILGVIGLGYVGLPLAVEKAKAGFRTIGFDVQESKVNMVNAGKNYIGDVVSEDLESIVKSGLLTATQILHKWHKLIVFVFACLHRWTNISNRISAM